MRWNALLAVMIGTIVFIMSGCGGGDGTTTPSPEPQDTSSIEGYAAIDGAAADYEVLLDGQPVLGVLRDDGTYCIENVPPGRHRVAVIARDGMEGGYAPVDVPDGERAEAPDIAPEVGGQIAGIVTVREDGGVRPLAGVEVTAQPAMTIMHDEYTGAEIPDADAPAIYPPPDDLPTFNAFTDDDGSYVLRAVPEGDYTVSVAQPNMQNGWKWVRVGAGRTAVADFRLRPTIEPGVGTVEGRVLGTQGGLTAPVAGARVTIMPETPWMPVGPPEIADDDVEPRDDDEGSEGDEGSDEGESEPGFPGDADIPEAGAIAPPEFETVSTVTDANGEFSLNAPSGYATIQVYLHGWEPSRQQIRILPGQTLTRRFELGALDGLPPGPEPVPMPEPAPEPGEPQEPDQPD